MQKLREQYQTSRSKLIKTSVDKKRVSAEKERLEHENAQLFRDLNDTNTRFNAMQDQYVAQLAERDAAQMQTRDLLLQSQRELQTARSELASMVSIPLPHTRNRA